MENILELNCFNWAQLVKKADLPANAKYIALYLSTFMNAEHDVAWPSMARISHETGLSKPTARKWLDYLNDAGWLVKSSQTRIVSTTGGSQKQNEYLIVIPADVLRGVNDLLPSEKGGKQFSKGGKAVDQRGVNESSKGGKQFSPNNNRITKNNNSNNNIVFPANLNIESWLEYLDYRKDRGEKKYTKKGEQMKTKWLAEQGDHETQKNIVNQSIMNNWAGLFELKPRGTTNEKNRPLSAGEQVREAIRERNSERRQAEIIDITPHGSALDNNG